MASSLGYPSGDGSLCLSHGHFVVVGVGRVKRAWKEGRGVSTLGKETTEYSTELSTSGKGGSVCRTKACFLKMPMFQCETLRLLVLSINFKTLHSVYMGLHLYSC